MVARKRLIVTLNVLCLYCLDLCQSCKLQTAMNSFVSKYTYNFWTVPLTQHNCSYCGTELHRCIYIVISQYRYLTIPLTHNTVISQYRYLTISLSHNIVISQYRYLTISLSHNTVIWQYRYLTISLSHNTVISQYRYLTIPLSHNTVISQYRYLTISN